jgi:hypothetical protein
VVEQGVECVLRVWSGAVAGKPPDELISQSGVYRRSKRIATIVDRLGKRIAQG